MGRHRLPRALASRRARIVLGTTALVSLSLAGAVAGARGAAAGSTSTRALSRSAGRAQLIAALESAHAASFRHAPAGLRPLRSTGTLTPAIQKSDPNLYLTAPANGSAWTWVQNGYMHFTWTNLWYCNCTGLAIQLIWDSTNTQVYQGTGPCPASSSPSCPTANDVTLNPGAYTWQVGEWFDVNGDTQVQDNEVTASDIWGFTLVGPSGGTTTTTAPPTTTTAPPPPPTTTATTTTAATTTTTAPPPPPPPAPKCHVPNVKGLRLADAQLKLFDANCSLGSVTRAHSKVVAKGRISAQAPGPGKTLPADAPVKVTVSLGK